MGDEFVKFWKQIDEMLRVHKAELEATTNACEAEGAIKGSTGINEEGRWCCRYIPEGERRQEKLEARSAPALLEALKKARAREKAPRR